MSSLEVRRKVISMKYLDSIDHEIEFYNAKPFSIDMRNNGLKLYFHAMIKIYERRNIQ